MANYARCFGLNPLMEDIQILLGGGDESQMCTLQEMESRALAFEDILPIVWALKNYKDPGCYEDFVEALKV